MKANKSNPQIWSFLTGFFWETLCQTIKIVHIIIPVVLSLNPDASFCSTVKCSTSWTK